MKISIGNDHAGTDYKNAIIEKLEADGHSVTNHGTDNEDSVDYPDFGHPVANDVEEGKADFGIVICGSGNGINMTVNKHAGIRSALCWNTELAALARQHNDANVLALPARFIDLDLALSCVETFLNEKFEGGRHDRRVGKIPC
ncbi:MAG: ribose 5-phosphate isomerase B [Flavobacteriia bacterium]|nr:ribose 5-phosphate isomerase B [Flavobacteriia bacterium]